MKKRVWLIGALVIAAIAVSLGFFWPFGRNGKELHIPGTVEIFEIRLGSKVGGRVAQVYVKEGEEVEAGRELVRFETPELDAQKAQLEQRLAAARAEYKKAKDGPRPQERADALAAMNAAKARLDRINEGWRKEEIRQAEDELAAAKSDHEFAEKNFERIRKLDVQVSQNEYDVAYNLLRTARARHNSAQAKVDMIHTGNREQDKREAQAQFDSAKAKYELLKEGTREEDIWVAEAQLKELEGKLQEVQANLNEALLVAPSKLIVEVLGVRKGDLVAPNTPVIRALSMEDRWVKVFVPSTELGKIQVGDAVEVTSDSYPGKRFKGTIIQIATISEFTPRNVQSLDERKHQVFGVKVRVEDSGEVFKAGMAAEVIVPLRKG
jgi:multidrug resistance efflux pump